MKTLAVITHSIRFNSAISNNITENCKKCNILNFDYILIGEKKKQKIWEQQRYLAKRLPIKLRSGDGKNLSDAIINSVNLTSSDFILYLSDEDSIFEENLQSIHTILNGHSPDLIASEFGLTRLRTTNYRRLPRSLLKTRDLWCLAHHPGLIWNRKHLLQVWAMKKELNTNFPVLMKYYPHIIPGLLALKKGTVVNNPVCIATQKIDEPDTHKNFRGISHTDLRIQCAITHELKELIEAGGSLYTDLQWFSGVDKFLLKLRTIKREAKAVEKIDTENQVILSLFILVLGVKRYIKNLFFRENKNCE